MKIFLKIIWFYKMLYAVFVQN